MLYHIDSLEVMECLKDKLYMSIINMAYDLNKNKVCFSNYYWKRCKVEELIYKDIEEIMYKNNVLKRFKLSLEDYEKQQDIDLFLHFYQLTKNIYDIVDWLDTTNYLVDNFEETYHDIQLFRDKWRQIFKSYIRITEANAKSTVIKALYHPKTMIGKIHVNALYNEHLADA